MSEMSVGLLETMQNGHRALTVRELAIRVEGAVEGDEAALVRGVSNIDDAQDGDIVFAENDKFLKKAARSPAAAIVAFLDAVTPDKPLIKVENPRFAFLKILELFRPELNVSPGVHPTAVVGKRVRLGDGASVGANATLGDDVALGDRAVVMPGCFVGDGCVVGPDCILYPNVTVYHGCTLGARVVIHSGSVIGADGFGYVQVGGRSYKVPQVGNVEIGDDVEIGANVTIDRAKTGSTVIGERTKIDNLVHVAHNVKTGPDCIIVAQVGVAGSTTMGQGVVIAGQAGINSHINIGNRVLIMGQAGVWSDVPDGQVVSGYPAKPHMDTQRSLVEMGKLPDTVKRLRALEKANAELNARLEAISKHLGLDEAAPDEGAAETA